VSIFTYLQSLYDDRKKFQAFFLCIAIFIPIFFGSAEIQNDHHKRRLLCLFVIFFFIAIKVQTKMSNFLFYFGLFGVTILSLQFFNIGKIHEGDVRYGVSNSAYFGFSPSRPIVYVLITFFVCILLRFYLISNLVEIDQSRKLHSRVNNLIIFSILSFFATNYYSNRISSIEAVPASLSWDAMNINTWSKFYSDGLFPMKDFWYPYGGILFLENGYLGALTSTAVVTLISYFIMKHFNGSGMNIFLQITLFILIPIIFFHDPITSIRYGFPIFALFFWVRSRSNVRTSLISSIYVGMSYFLSQELSFFSLILFVLLNFINYRDYYQRKSLYFLVRFVLPIFFYGLNLLFLLYNGAFVNTFNFILRPTETLHLSSSVNFGLKATFPVISLDSILVLTLLALAIFLSPVRHFFQSIRTDHLIPNTSIICVSFLLYLSNKELNRGGMLLPALIAIVPMFLLLTMSSSVQNNLESKRENEHKFSLVYRSILHFIFIIVFFWSGSPSVLLQRVIDFPTSSSRSLNSFPPSESHLLKNMMSNPDPTEPDILKIESTLDNLSLEDTYVLGDQPLLYWKKGHSNFWTISNWSTFSAQNETLKRLEQIDPRYIYFDTTAQTLNFDLVPAHLRSPDIYRYVISNYSPFLKLAKGDLLVKNENGENPIYSYWISKFGSTVNLNYIGYGTSIPTLCQSGNSCTPYLVSTTTNMEGFKSVNFVCGISKFEVTFQAIKDREIFVPLEKLWFWNNTCTISSDAPPWAYVSLMEKASNNFAY
jgi:hypothetical protein